MFLLFFKKTFLYWKRNKGGSCVEIIMPFLLVFFIAGLRSIVDITQYQETSYTSNYFATSLNKKSFPANYTIANRFKNCNSTSPSGGRIGLAPKNEITEALGKFFKNSSPYEIVFFDDDKGMDDYLKQEDYTDSFENGTMRQLCFGVTFDQYDLKKNKFEYNLRFNISGNVIGLGNNVVQSPLDHFDTKSKQMKLQYEVDNNNDFLNVLEKGPLSLQILIDSFILDKKDKYLYQNVGIRKMKSPKYTYRNLGMLVSVCVYAFILEGIIVFLRIIGQIVGEREAGNVENMENMGMKKIHYILGTISFNALVQFIIGFIFSFLLKFLFFKETDYFILLFTYYVFIYNMMMLGFFMSCFFSSSKKGIIAAICVLIFSFVFSLIQNNLMKGGELITSLLCISPLGSIPQVLKNYIAFESTNAGFHFYDFDAYVNNFRAKTFFFFGIGEILFFFIMGLYLFHVVPLEIGIPQHPLFCLGFPLKKKKKYEDLNESNINLNSDGQKSHFFETIENELMQQKKDKTTIEITNLRKVYSNKKIAVNNLNVDMFSNQIFSLLGHNGAGKTTTISIISGFLNKSSGSIKIYGLDSTDERQQIKKLIGVCPQKNPIFPYMTVWEHVVLYASIKGVKIDNEFTLKVEEVLKDIDLFHKKDYWAEDLSGGQKRKLCVAMAFIGDSKIILLDEPTSGMDTYARRLLWEMIKKYKLGRLIILTTHNMDEADYLGDRIGIMAEGKMITCGSSLFLKNKFGAGYELTIVKQNGLSVAKSKIIQDTVLNSCQNALFVGDIGTEMKFQLPTENASQFSNLFGILENDKNRLGIDAFGISLTTLEEVFLKVCNGTGEVSREDVEKERLKKEAILEENKDIESKDLSQLRLKNEALIFALQVGALIKKRIIYFSRDLPGVFCELLLPIIIVIIGLAFTKIEFFSNAPLMNVQSNIYPYQFKMNGLKSGTKDLSSTIIDLFDPNNLKFEVLDVSTENDFDQSLYENKSFNQNYAYFLNKLRPSEYNYTIFVNSTCSLGANVAVNNINNALLKYYAKDDSAQIITNLQPFPQPNGPRNYVGGLDGFVLVVLIGIAYTFIPASMIVFLIKEREHNAKHQQLVSGVNIFAYWLSNFLVDFVKYLIVALLTIALIYIFDVSFFLERDHNSVLFIIFILYGVTLILLVYAVSFLFTDSAKGQIVIFLMTAFFSTFGIAITYVMRILESTRNFSLNILENILYVFPQFAFCFGLLHLPNVNLYLYIFKWNKRHKALSEEVSGKSIVYLSVMALIFLIVIIVMELSYKLFPYINKKNDSKIAKLLEKEKNNIDILTDQKYSNLFKSSNKTDEVDIDVLEEEKQVKDLNNKWSVRVTDLKKVYNMGGFMGFGVRKHKLAVKGITFGITPGTVFGLLGTNGAGKTSTFKILTGDVFPSSGFAEIMGYKMPESLAQIRHLIGYCPQFDSILEKLTTQEHLYMYCSLKGINPNYHKYLVDQLIETMNLQKFRHVEAGTYSGGNKRKLSVAIAMLGKPPIIFLDEPSSGMDPKARRFMWSVINDISNKRKHSSVILTTHSMEEAEALSSKLAIMVEGKIKTIGSVQQLKKKYGKCFELELKMEMATPLEIEERKTKISEILETDKKELNFDDLKLILDSIERNDLIAEIRIKGYGHFIYLEIEKRKIVDVELFIEWLDLNEKFNRIYDYLRDHFEGTELLESLQSFAKFKIPDKNKLSSIFKELETFQKILSIRNYSVKQISLEQIFVQFAEVNTHEGD